MACTASSLDRRAPRSRPLMDGFRRAVTYLRVSLTDRCNLRCVYCMPADGLTWKPKDSILSFEEIVRIARVARARGVRKLRLTGGEPLVRTGCAELVARLAELGFEELCLTTNGIRFAPLAPAFKAAGLTRVNISLDTLDPAKYRAITRGGDLGRVLDAIEAALAHDLAPRLNVVAMRGFNDDELPALAELSRDRPLTVRFIEVMPFSAQRDPRLEAEAPDHAVDCEARDVQPLPLEEVRRRLGLPPALAFSLAPGGLPVLNTDGPAEYTRLPGAVGQIGFIASMHQHICDRCNRVRLTADGWLKPCLLGSERLAVLPAARAGDEAAIAAAFDQLMAIKPRHGRRDVLQPESMSAIGG
jgi:cyclic pyranopterin phosphate synthase